MLWQMLFLRHVCHYNLLYCLFFNVANSHGRSLFLLGFSLHMLYSDGRSYFYYILKLFLYCGCRVSQLPRNTIWSLYCGCHMVPQQVKFRLRWWSRFTRDYRIPKFFYQVDYLPIINNKIECIWRLVYLTESRWPKIG